MDGFTRTKKAARVVKGLEQNAFDTEWLEGSARINVESEKLNIGGSATIRLEKDKAIWVSVKKFGLEGARALVRPDSFFVYNRLTGETIAEPLSFIEEKYQVPARFDLLQEIVLGNAVFFTRKLDLTTEGETYRLSGSDQGYATNYAVNGRGLLLEEMALRELASGREVSIQNDDFRDVKGGKNRFAHDRTVRIDSKETGEAKVVLNFSKVSLNGPLKMPFRRR